MRDVLGIGEVENPEEQLTITPQHRGSLVHDVLERFIAGVLDRPPAPDEAWGAPDEERLERIAHAVFAAYEAKGLTGRAVFWGRERKRIMADLSKVLELDSEYRRTHGTRPLAAELRFGFPDSDLGVVRLGLADGRSVGFLGLADRVDVGDDGSLHVVDYKTGRSGDYSRLDEDNPDLGGHPPAVTGVRRSGAGAPRHARDLSPRRVLVHVVEGQVQAHRLRGDAGRPVPGRRVAGRDRRRYRGGRVPRLPESHQHDPMGGVPLLRPRRSGRGGSAAVVEAQSGRAGVGRVP